MSRLPRQPRGGDAVGRLLRSAWRYKWLLAAAVLLGALLGYGWASRQPTRYQAAARVLLAGPGSPSLPGAAPQPVADPERYLRQQAALLSSPAVLQHAVRLSGSRISPRTLGQRLQVDIAEDADVITIRVDDSTATGAAQLADAVAAAYDAVLTQKLRERSRGVVSQLRSMGSRLKARIAELDAELASRPNDGRLRAQRAAAADQLALVQRKLAQTVAADRSNGVALRERAAVPDRPIQPRPGRAMVIGMLMGLLASGALAWWLGRPPGTLTMVAAEGR